MAGKNKKAYYENTIREHVRASREYQREIAGSKETAWDLLRAVGVSTCSDGKQSDRAHAQPK